MLKKIFIAPIKGYQYLSSMFPASCRYYPTCSEYAKWQFELNRADKAMLFSTLRILRCNQLFAGGIDYPVVEYKKPLLLSLALQQKYEVNYWLFPKEKQTEVKKFYVIKDFSAT